MIKSNNNVDSAKLTTIYSSTNAPSGWGTNQYVYVEQSKNTSLRYSICNIRPNDEQLLIRQTNDYIKRVAFDAKSSFHLCNGKNITEKLTISTEPVVIRFIDKNDPFKVDARSLTSDSKSLLQKQILLSMSKNKSANIVDIGYRAMQLHKLLACADDKCFKQISLLSQFISRSLQAGAMSFMRKALSG